MIKQWDVKSWELSTSYRHENKEKDDSKVDISGPEVSTPNYVTLVNDLIPGHCTHISHESGQRINNNLAKKAGSVRTKYSNSKNSGERGQLYQKTLKVTIFQNELVSLKGVEEELNGFKTRDSGMKEKNWRLESLKERTGKRNESPSESISICK